VSEQCVHWVVEQNKLITKFLPGMFHTSLRFKRKFYDVSGNHRNQQIVSVSVIEILVAIHIKSCGHYLRVTVIKDNGVYPTHSIRGG